jgi:hypothetical protein
MKQYCRYCAHCVGETDYVNVSWCSEKQKEMSSNTAKSVNHCKSFVFNPIDAFNIDSGRYKPRVKKATDVDNGQLLLF